MTTAAETPGALDLEIYQGDTYTLTLRLKTVDASGVFVSWVNLTGYTGLAQIRTSASSGTVQCTFTVTLANQTTTPGQVVLTLAPATTASLPPTSAGSLMLWDFQMTDGAGTVKTYLRGSVTVDAEVSRP